MNHREHCATNLQHSGAGPMAGGCWVQGRAVGWLIPYSDDIKGELPLTLVLATACQTSLKGPHGMIMAFSTHQVMNTDGVASAAAVPTCVDTVFLECQMYSCIFVCLFVMGLGP